MTVAHQHPADGRRLALARLNAAFEAGDEGAFEAALRELDGDRQARATAGMQRVSELLLAALTRFRSESRIAALAAREVPEARLRLDHVIGITADVANRTIDIIEQLRPLTDATARRAAELADSLAGGSHDAIRAYLEDVQQNATRIRENLMEVLLAQGFQDLTGQIIRSVRTLVDEIEAILKELACSAGVNLSLAEGGTTGALQGPAVPGVTSGTVSGQDDVDDLIAGLGI